MTAIDQAFIRAYEQPEPEPAQEATAHLLASNDMQPWVSAVQYASPSWETAMGLETTNDAADRHLTHHRIDKQTVQQTVQQTDGHDAQTSAAKPTLSAIMASRQQPSNHSTPATTVDTFRLPAICRQLLTSHSSAYEQVVSTLLANMDEGRTVIGLASCQIDTGCTSNLLCLASRLQAQGKSVVLVDANFARPGLANALGLSPMTSWQDVLHSGAPIAEALVRSARDGLAVLPSEQAPSNTALDDVARLQASVTAGALRYEFDVTLVDLGVSDQTTSLELAQAMRVDAALLVVDPTRNNLNQQQKAQRRLEQRGCSVLGTIEVGKDESAA